MKLGKNSPNPFNTSTSIDVFISHRLDVPAKLDIYDANGKLVKKLADNIIDSGHYKFIWDGTNSKNIVAPSGTYIYKLENGKYEISGKMTLVK